MRSPRRRFSRRCPLFPGSWRALAGKITHRVADGSGRRLPVLGLFLILTAICGSAAQGASCSWQVPSGDWSAASNWGGTLPASSDAAYIVNGGTTTVTQPGAVCGTLSLGSGAGSGSLQMTGGSLFASSYEYVGNWGMGALIQSGGTNNVSNALNVGYSSGSSGTYSLSGPGVLSAGNESVGVAGTGSFIQSGGTNNIVNKGYLWLDNNGSYSLSSGVLTAGYEYVGNTTSATFTQSGGINTPGVVYLAYNAGSSGAYNLSGPTTLAAAFVYVGFSGAGTLTQSSGMNACDDSLCVGYNSGSRGTYTQSGGTVTSNSPLYLGANAGSSGIYSLSGSGLVSSNATYVGYSGSGTFTQSGGTNNFSYSTPLYIGVNAGSKGSYNLGGLGMLYAGYEYVGASGTGALIQSGGTNTVSGALYIGQNTGSSGSYNLSGSGVLLAGPEYVGDSGTGTLTQSGGSNAAYCVAIGAEGRYQFSGGTLQINAGGGLASQGAFDATGSTGVLTTAGSSIIDLSQATLVNTGSLSVAIGPNSLLLVPPGFNPATALRSYGNLGLTHTAGTPLTVASGQGFSGLGFLADHVNCQGTIAATTGGSINLNGGVTVSGTGNVTLADGSFTVDDTQSGISGGRLLAPVGYVGSSGHGAFAQSGGSNLTTQLSVGYNAGSSGSYVLSGSGLLSVSDEYVGNSGTGIMSQSGGTHNVGFLCLGSNAGSSGSYQLSGSGLLSASFESVGDSGNGTFTQSGGTNNVSTVYLGGNAGSSGSYQIGGPGLLSANSEYIGTSGSGTFSQTGGTNNLNGGNLYLGYDSATTGSYSLSGSGVLLAANEYVGSSGTGAFRQTGGWNVSNSLAISSSSRYQFSGGTLQAQAFANQGVFDATGSSGVLNVAGSSIVDLSQAVLVNTSSMSLSIGSNSLLLVPAGFNPATALGSYANAGLTHNVGTPLVISGGTGFSGNGTITDLASCEGTISAVTGGSINLDGGVVVSGTGNVNLGNGSFIASGNLSNITGGSLSASAGYVGYSGTAAFVQAGGTCNNYSLYLGFDSGSNGSYSLSGSTAICSSNSEYLGSSGSGVFTQLGGTNTAGGLFSGKNFGSNGIYSLTGSGTLAANSEFVGYSGSGTFNQSGGTNNYASNGTYLFLWLGANAGSSGSYSLTGPGLLSAGPEYVGNSGTGIFTQSGGTNVSDTLFLGGNVGLSGSYNLSGSGVLTASEYVGYGSVGTFAQSGGTNNCSLYVGFSQGSSGSYSLSGSGLLSASQEFAGYYGTGTFTQAGGTNSTAYLFLGNNLSSCGSYSLSGSGVLSAAYEYVGLFASTFNQSAGTNMVTNSLILAGPGSYNLTGGALAVCGIQARGGTFTFSGGTLVAGAGFTTAQPMTLTGSGGNINTAGYAVTLSGSLTGPGGLNKWGAGTLTLATSNAYGGGTTIYGGAIALNNANALSNSTVTVNINNGLRFNTNNGAITTFNVGALAGAGNIGLSDGTYPVTLSAGGNGASTIYSGVLDGPGGLTKTGSGTLVLCDNNTYTGPTTVAGGTLLLDFSQPGAPTANIINNNNGEFVSSLTLAAGTLAIQGVSGTANSQEFAGLTIEAGGFVHRPDDSGQFEPAVPEPRRDQPQSRRHGRFHAPRRHAIRHKRHQDRWSEFQRHCRRLCHGRRNELGDDCRRLHLGLPRICCRRPRLRLRRRDKLLAHRHAVNDYVRRILQYAQPHRYGRGDDERFGLVDVAGRGPDRQHVRHDHGRHLGRLLGRGTDRNRSGQPRDRQRHRQRRQSHGADQGRPRHVDAYGQQHVHGHDHDRGGHAATQRQRHVGARRGERLRRPGFQPRGRPDLRRDRRRPGKLDPGRHRRPDACGQQHLYGRHVRLGGHVADRQRDPRQHCGEYLQ